MPIEPFEAGVQYGDIKGSVAADYGHDQGVRQKLQSLDLMQSGELLAGIQINWSEEKSRPGNTIGLTALILLSTQYKTLQEALSSGHPLPVRRVKIEVPLAEFFGLFKQFEMTLSPKGVVEGKEIYYES